MKPTVFEIIKAESMAVDATKDAILKEVRNSSYSSNPASSPVQRLENKFGVSYEKIMEVVIDSMRRKK